MSGDIRIVGDRIAEVGEKLLPGPGERVLELDGRFVYPGLINSHDHLEFNLYPRLGDPPYRNYEEWSKDIYQPDRSPIREIRQISLEDRLIWGAIKNVISGVTTVVHHNPHYKRFKQRFMRKPFPVRVLRNYQWLHSLKLGEPNTHLLFDTSSPFIIHAAEGTDEDSRQEIAVIHQKGWLRNNTVIIHGIAITDKQVEMLIESNVSLVWCPSSNMNLYGRTAPIQLLKDKIRIALGTDSTLSGSATIFEEMRAALATGWVSEQEIFDMVTRFPGSIFGIRTSSTWPEAGAWADLLVLTAKRPSYYANLLDAVPADVELLLCEGEPRLVDQVLAPMLSVGQPNAKIYERSKWIGANIRTLKKRIERIVPRSFLDQNSLWPHIEGLTS